MSLAGTMLGFYPVRVLPSKTAIAPVNPTFLPRVSEPLFFLLTVQITELKISGIRESIVSFNNVVIPFYFGLD